MSDILLAVKLLERQKGGVEKLEAAAAAADEWF